MDLVGITEIAQRHGTSPGMVRVWRSRHTDFPKPAALLAMGPVWRWDEVERWLRGRKRKATV